MSTGKVSRRGQPRQFMVDAHLFNFYVPRAQFEALRIIATAQGTSVADLLRQMAEERIVSFFGSARQKNHDKSGDEVA